VTFFQDISPKQSFTESLFLLVFVHLHKNLHGIYISVIGKRVLLPPKKLVIVGERKEAFSDQHSLIKRRNVDRDLVSDCNFRKGTVV